MCPYTANYMRIGEEPAFADWSTITTTTGIGGWSIDMSQEPMIWIDPASWPFKNKIEKALGATHYVKSNKLFRR